MKSIKTFVAVIALAASFGSFAAQTVTASASTLDGAEAENRRTGSGSGRVILQNYPGIHR